MPHIETVTAIESYRDRCEDRVRVIAHEDQTIIVVADGAGGVGAGDLAAEAVVREIAGRHGMWGGDFIGGSRHKTRKPRGFEATLRDIDDRSDSRQDSATHHGFVFPTGARG